MINNKKRGIVILFLILFLITISIYVEASSFVDTNATWTGTFSNTTNNGNNITLILIPNPLQKINLTPTDDAYVSSTSPATNYGSSADLITSNSGVGNPVNAKFYVKFNITSIPPNSSIYSAILYLNVYSTYTIGSLPPTYRVISDWNESTVTWDTAPTVNSTNLHFWPFYNGVGWYSSSNDLAEIVRTWFNGTYTNYGLLINPPPSDTDAAAYIRSKEYGTASSRPYLNVNYYTNYNDTTYNNTGTYLSKVFDFGTAVSWDNISWVEAVPYQEELPTNQQVEIVFHGVNMTENVLYMRFNNDSNVGESYAQNGSTTHDYSGLGNNGSIYGNAGDNYNNTGGKLYGAFDFDGVDDHIRLTNDIVMDGTSSSISMWFRTYDFEGCLAGKWLDDDSYIMFNTNDAILFQTDTVATMKNFTFKDMTLGKWHHLVLTRSSSTTRLYLDSVESSSGGQTQADDFTVNLIGRYSNQVDWYFNGTMDEVAIWNRTLSAQEVEDVYLRGIARLNISIHDCDDAACSGEESTWDLTCENATFCDISSAVSAAKYFQYKATFTTDSSSYTPALNNVTVYYYYENITIQNIGQLGFNATNQEYTALRTVLLILNYSSSATSCRYKNSDGDYDNWDTCTGQKYWLLSSGYGSKQVFYQINHSDNKITTLNDTIYYNYTGAGLDTTPPSPPIITDGDFTNVNTSLYISWTNSTDLESDLLNIPLIYNYYIFVNGILNRSGTTTNTLFNETGFNFQHNDNITVNITVINSAGLTSSTLSDGLVIDLLDPLPPTITSSIPENIWNSSNAATFNWNSSDNVSGIAAYSYILTTGADEPDDVPEGNIGSLANELNKTYSSLADNIYYFKVKAKDNAGNWGNLSNYTIKIDATAPDKPIFISEVFNSAQRIIVYNYTNVSDLSGIPLYQINITNITGGTSTSYNNSNITSFQLNDTSHTNYYFKVRARNGALLWSIWSDETTIVSDIIKPAMWVKPQGTITSKKPIFVVKTNEQSVCKYSNLTNPSASDFTNFTYTNSTYHEIKVTSDGDTYNITCTDIYGNINSTLITFTYSSSSVTSAPSLSTSSAFTGQITNLSVDTAENFGEIDKSRFGVYIDGTKLNDLNLVDEGYGNYTIIMDAPFRAGTYAINVTIDSGSALTTLNVYNLTLTINYTKSGLTVQNRTRLLYNDYVNYTVGLATDSGIVDIYSDTNNMLVKSFIEDSGLIIVTDRIDNVQRKERYLEYGNFFDLFRPSFGYSIGDYNEIKIILDYPSYDINGSEELFAGRHNLLIKNIRPDENNKKRLLITTELTNTTEKGVFSYEG